MFLLIAGTLPRRSPPFFCPPLPWQAQHVDGAVDAGLGRLHRIVLVMYGRSRTGKIVDLVDLKIDRKGYIVPDELEVFVVEQMLDVRACAGKKVVETNDVGALRQQAFAQVRPEKTGAACNKDTSLEMHTSCLE